jgi:hypothetical protein
MLLGYGVAGKQKQRRYDSYTKDTSGATSILIITQVGGAHGDTPERALQL